MIEARELRIGNLIIRNDQVKPVTSTTIDNAANGFAYMIHPIPLTAEWLTKAGFEIDDDDYLYSYQSDHAVFPFGLDLVTNNLGNIDLWVYFGDQVISVLDGYVHTLQNLFHSITRHELEFKD